MTENARDRFLSLADELQLVVAGFLSADDLLRLHCVSSHFRQLDVSDVWKDVCKRRWADWPRYRLTREREQALDGSHPDLGWKGRYFLVERDVTRTTITQNEIEDLGWHFNFTPAAGGRGADTLSPCSFFDGRLYVRDYPPLPVEVVEIKEGTMPFKCPLDTVECKCGPFSKDIWVNIGDFPPHFVARIPSDGEWLIANENVSIVSCKPTEGVVSYDGRRFL